MSSVPGGGSMIYILHGENEFLKKQRLVELAESIGGELERVDGEGVDEGRLRDLLFGRTLFDSEQLVVITDLSSSDIWQKLPEIIGSHDIEVILLESRLDKRTKVYKWLQKNAKLEEFKEWSDYDKPRAVKWLVGRAKDYYGFDFTDNLATQLIDRLGVNQLRLDAVLEQLSLSSAVNSQTIDDLVPLPKTENVFELLKSTLDGNLEKVKQTIAYLEMIDGPDGAYRTIGLLTSQLLALNGLVLGGTPSNVASDLAVHPNVVRNLQSYAEKISPKQIGQVNQVLGRADMSVKTTSVSPWLVVEAALVEVANIIK